MNDLLRLCDCIVCVLRGWERIDAVCVFVWDMMQTEQAVLLLFFWCSAQKSPHKHTFYVALSHPFFSHSCSNGFHWHQIQRFILLKQIQLMQTTWDCYMETQAAKYHCWADVKYPQADLIPYLHLKDHSTFKHKLMMHNIISISSKFLQQTFHLYKSTL